MSIRRKWRRLSFEKKLSIVGVPLLLVLVSGVAVPRLNELLARKAPELHVVDIVVENTTDWTTPTRLQVTLHNTGNERAIIKRALFRIHHFSQIPNCVSEGELPVSKTYDIILPVNPHADQLVEAPVSQQLGTDEADRFTFTLTVPQDINKPSSYIYQLEVALLHDEGQTPLKLGNVLVALPGLPSAAGGDFWPSVPGSLGSFGAQAVACLKSNSLKLHQMLALDGKRSQQLRDLADQLG